MTKNPILIGIAGYARTGKTTAAEALEGSGFAHLSFAAPIRLFARQVFGAIDPLFDLEADKGRPFPQFGGCTPREFMQKCGTEFGRQMIDPELWVKVALSAALEHVRNGRSAVISDVRFENEAQAIRDAGGVVLWLKRPGYSASDHASEKGLPADLVDFILHNDADLPRLRKGVLELAHWAAVWKRLYEPLAGDVEEPAVRAVDAPMEPGYPISADEE